MNVEDIHFHDSKILRVIEVPARDLLAMELDYPIDWQANLFAPQTLIFHDVLGYTVAEGPFAGSPTIMGCSASVDGKLTRIILETNAGQRSLSCTRIELVDGHGAV